MQTAPLVSNAVTLDVLQRLFNSESKPSSVKPVDMAVLAYLVLRRCEDHEIFDSQGTIGLRIGSDRQAVALSLGRLERLKWITVSGRGMGNPKAISINFDAFPAAQPIRDKITPNAQLLVARYWAGLQKLGKRKFPKNWPKRQLPSAQRILTACGDDFELARRIVSYGMTAPKYKVRSRTSLHHLLTTWKALARDYAHATHRDVPQGEAQLGETQEGESVDQFTATQ